MPQPVHRFSERSFKSWEELLQTSTQPEQKYQAFQALLSLAAAADLPRQLARGLGDPDSCLRAAATRWFAIQAEKNPAQFTEAIWQEIPAFLPARLTDEDPDVRFEAARGLLALNAQNESAQAVLLSLLKDSETHPTMLASVLKALANGSPPVETTVVAWDPLLTHELAEVREQTARILGVWGPRFHACVPQLLTLLDDEEPYVREEAVRAVSSMGLAHANVIQALETATTDEDEIVAEAARTALIRLRQHP